MKKFSALIIGLSFAFPLAASAATFNVSPSSGTYNIGDTVTLNVSVNPAGSTIYTAMLDARFSPANFEVVSFTLNDALLPLKQAGYDALDNGGGILTKTGGYSGGITSTASFGTIVLRAKSAGSATFTVADSSKLLDGNNADQQSGSQTSTFSIIAKPAPEVKLVSAQTNTTAAPKETKAVSKTQPAATSATTSTAEASSTQVAAVAQSGVMGGGLTFWLLEILALAVAFGAGYFAGTRKLIR